MDADQIAQIVQIAINVIGFGILIPYIVAMRKRLNNQSQMLDEQNKMFEGAKAFLDFANPKNLKETAEDIVALKEERMKEENEKIIRELNEKMKEIYGQSVKNRDLMIKEMIAMAELGINLLYYVPPNKRKEAIEEVSNSWFKDLILKDLENRPYWGQVLSDIMGGKKISATDPLLRARREAAIQKATRQE